MPTLSTILDRNTNRGAITGNDVEVGVVPLKELDGIVL